MRDADLVLAGEFGEGSQDLFDLLGEYIDALDLHHVVASACDHIDAGELASARALARNDPGKVVSAETDERRALLDKRRDDDLAPLAVGDVLTRCRIDDLQINIVVPVVHSGVILAVDADAGSVDFSQSVNIIQLNAQLCGNALAHLLAPALGSDNALFEVDLVRDAALLDLFRQKKSVGRRRAQNCGLKVHHHLQLLVGVAGSHGDRHRAEFLTAVLEADTCSPQAVSGRDMNAVLFGDSGKLIAALEHLAPVVDVLGGIGNDDGHSCCTG